MKPADHDGRRPDSGDHQRNRAVRELMGHVLRRLLARAERFQRLGEPRAQRSASACFCCSVSDSCSPRRLRSSGCWTVYRPGRSGAARRACCAARPRNGLFLDIYLLGSAVPALTPRSVATCGDRLLFAGDLSLALRQPLTLRSRTSSFRFSLGLRHGLLGRKP